MSGFIGWLVAIAFCGFMFFSGEKPKQYQAEVSYHAGDGQGYEYGSIHSTKKGCYTDADAIMTYYTAADGSSTRVTGWVCLVRQGGSIISKVN